MKVSETVDGFQPEKFKDEVEQRWGREAYAQSHAWWTSITTDEKQEFRQQMAALNHDWETAVAAGVVPDSGEAQALAARHVEWLRTASAAIPHDHFRDYVMGLGELYVSDPRFAANYGGEKGASFVRDALVAYATLHLSSD